MNLLNQLHPRDILTNLFLGLIFCGGLSFYYYGYFYKLPGFGKLDNTLYIAVIIFIAYFYGLTLSNIFYATTKKFIRTKHKNKLAIFLKKNIFGIINKSVTDYAPNSFSNVNFNKKDLLDNAIMAIFPDISFNGDIKYEKISGLVMAYIRENASAPAYFNVERQFQFFNFYSRLLSLSFIFSLINIAAIFATYQISISYTITQLIGVQIFLYYFTRLSGSKYQQAYSTHRKYAWNLFMTLALTKKKTSNKDERCTPAGAYLYVCHKPNCKSMSSRTRTTCYFPR